MPLVPPIASLSGLFSLWGGGSIVFMLHSPHAQTHINIPGYEVVDEVVVFLEGLLASVDGTFYIQGDHQGGI